MFPVIRKEITLKALQLLEIIPALQDLRVLQEEISESPIRHSKEM
jgi:hypothetical protein